MLYLKVKPDVLISDERIDYDAIVFVGGGGASEYFHSPVAHALARNFYSHGKVTSAICIAPAILANAGLLKEKKATSFPSSEETLKSRGAVFTMDDVVVDGKIITGVGPEAAKRFGEKLVEGSANVIGQPKDHVITGSGRLSLLTRIFKISCSALVDLSRTKRLILSPN
jgi:protease I